MTPLLRKFLGLNWILFATMMALLVFRVFAIYSACWMREAEGLSMVWRKQVYYIVAGLIAFFAATDRNLLSQGVFIGASVLPGLRGCKGVQRGLQGEERVK